MSLPPEQQATAALLRRLTGGADPLETHISAVFIGPDRVLKLKKAVSLGFLDFSALAARERFCRRELEINAPAAPGLYRAVHAVTRAADGRLALDGEGPAVDWVLEMAPLPAADFFEAIAARGGLDAPLLEALGDSLAALHASLPPVSGWNAPGALRQVLEGNVGAALAAGLDPARIAAWAEAARDWLGRLSFYMAARAAQGWVRRCHGDMHLGNLALWQGRPVAFDALEFDEALATIDTGYDLAFPLADLEVRLGRAAANRLLNRYVARSGDAGLLTGLPLWLSLRAMIRAHCLARIGRDAEAYLDFAESVLRPVPGRLVALGGLPGTGKSWLARRLAPDLGPAPGALILRSDEIRKRLHGLAPEQPLRRESYTPAASAAVYGELFAQARQALAAGQAVIADANFLQPEIRAGIETVGQPFQGFWLEAPLALLCQRVAARQGDASDAGVEVLKGAATVETGPITWARLDAAGDSLAEARKILGE